jgi:hypothetical protein
MVKLNKITHIFVLVIIAGLSTAYFQPTELQETEKANEWLNKMAEAVIEPGTTIEEITTDIEQTIVSQMGDVTFTGTTTFNFVNGNQSALLDTPQGEIEVIIEDGEGIQRMGGQEYPMNAAQLQDVKLEMERNYVNVALNKDSLETEFLGTETIEDTEYAMLKVNLTVPITYYLDMETALPAILKYTQFNQQTGQEFDIEVQYDDWQTVSGLTYAFSVETFANSEIASSATINELTVN